MHLRAQKHLLQKKKSYFDVSERKQSLLEAMRMVETLMRKGMTKLGIFREKKQASNVYL